MDTLNYSWHWSPFTLIGLIILCLLYILGVRQTRKLVGPDSIKIQHLLAFITAIVLIAGVFLSPIDIIARTQLLSAHMLQAIILTTICAPLLIFASPAALLQPLVNRPVIKPIFGIVTQPIVASLLFNLTFLGWHAPILFNAALANGTLYHIELLSFLLAALLNWWPLIGSVREQHKLGYPAQMLYAFLDGQPVDIFAFLIVFTGTVFYHSYTLPPQFLATGFSAVADQTVAGAFLLIPGLVDLVVMSPLFFRWLGQIEQQAKIADQRRQEELEAEAEELEELEESR